METDLSQEQMYAEIINLLSGMTVGRTKPVALTADESLVLARLTGAWMKKLQLGPPANARMCLRTLSPSSSSGGNTAHTWTTFTRTRTRGPSWRWGRGRGPL